jgi:hypothetical protein
MVRSATRKKAGAGSAVSSKGKPGRKARAASVGGVSEFKKAALDLGLANARVALDDLERGLAALIG